MSVVCDIHFRMPWRPGELRIQVSSLKFLFILFIAFFDENNHQVKIGAYIIVWWSFLGCENIRDEK